MLNDFVKYYQYNPYRFVEQFLGIKLPLHKKIYLKISYKLYDRTLKFKGNYKKYNSVCVANTKVEKWFYRIKL